MLLLKIQMVLKLQDRLDNTEKGKSELLWKLTLLEFFQTHNNRSSRFLGKWRAVHFAAVTTSNRE